MSIEDNYENYEIDVTAKFPAFLIDNNEEGYTLFSWEDEKGFEKIPSDRAFTIEGKGLSDDDESLLSVWRSKEGKFPGKSEICGISLFIKKYMKN